MTTRKGGDYLNIDTLTIQSILATPRQSVLYQVTDGTSFYVLKTPKNLSDSDLEAYEDEYETLKKISHPVIPKYYAFYSDLYIPDFREPRPAILMEYVEGTPLSTMEYLTTKQLKKYILDLGDALLTLLMEGVLYTDLHPGNLILRDGQIKLIDYTRAYYYLRNPYPTYTPKISYQLDQNLKGQQLLVQALTFLLLHLAEQFSVKNIPLSILQWGEHPHSALTFSDFLNQLDREWEV